MAPPADLYALGAVGFYLLSGRHLFDGNAIEVCVKHVKDPPPAMPEQTPPALAGALSRCLAKSPEQRPTAAGLADELDTLQLDDWSDAHARAWWARFPVKRGVVDYTTRTVTIDLGGRA